METQPANMNATTKKVKPILPNYLTMRPEDSHKGHYGHALLIAGSYGKMGAAVLAAKASLRSGVGLLTVHVPKCGVDILQTAVPEAMIDVDEDEYCFSSLPASLEQFDAVAIGPGLGCAGVTARAMEQLLHQRGSMPLVIDADGLNLLAAHDEWLPLVKGSLLTPHAGEFERLFGSAVGDRRLELQKSMALELGCDILYKGHRSTVVCRTGDIFVNTTGNAGMATAGSGDVLTGVALGLCAQRKGFEKHGLAVSGMPELLAAVYLHGKSADIAVQKQSKASLMASDIVENLKYAID